MLFEGYKTCFALDCDITIPRAYLMCKEHWNKVPVPLQSEVYRTFHLWCADGSIRPYVLATLRARLAVAELDPRPKRSERIEILRAEIQRREQLEAQS